VLTKAPLLLEEMLKIAMLPRTQAGTGWMVGRVAALMAALPAVLACLLAGTLQSIRCCHELHAVFNCNCNGLLCMGHLLTRVCLC
jgi:hypothetical protein